MNEIFFQVWSSLKTLLKGVHGLLGEFGPSVISFGELFDHRINAIVGHGFSKLQDGVDAIE